MSATDDTLNDEILSIVAKEASIDRALLRPEARIDDLGIASIDLTMAVFGLEKHFDIEIPVLSGSGGDEFATVGDLVAHVRRVLDRKTDGGAA